MRQKAAIALAFVRPFELMLVDEPFVGLDQAGKEALLELFRRAHEDGATLVVATHELTTVKEAERVIALRDGTIIFDGPTDQADPRPPGRALTRLWVTAMAPGVRGLR